MSSKFSLLCSSLLSSLLLGGCSTHIGRVGGADPPKLKRAYTVQRDIIYTPKGWPEALPGDLYRPRTDGPSPAVLLVHGGGWTGKDNRWQMNGIARQLARRGYVVFNATYRRGPRWKYPAPADDLREAVAWMRAHAKEQGIDEKRIAGYGYSAGAHLVSLIGLEKGPKDPRFVAIVAGGTPADLTLAGPGLVSDFLNGTKEQIPARYVEASPVHYVNRSSPPVFLYHGHRDKLVPLAHVERFTAALEKSGVPHEVYWLNGRGHMGAFILYGGSHKAAINFLDRVMRGN